MWVASETCSLCAAFPCSFGERGGGLAERAFPRVTEPLLCRKHLQEIPSSGSNVSTSFSWDWDSSKTSELLSGMGVSVLRKDRLGNENTPQEPLLPTCTPHKRPKVKEKEFVIVRRPRLLREAEPGVSWDALPDELLLAIFAYLPLNDLLKVSVVCKRWHRLS
ncbi:UNVERIFIED_CONTAM: hypothetical protein H355_006626 [Colinus virginianus]|nr:hypothetical protein H355_006626 [Colinus virginianus]